MIYKSIRLFHFKCYDDVQVDFHPALNCIVGSNGAGKTNLMDALYFSCFTKSYFTTKDQFVLQDSAPFLRLEGHWDVDGEPFDAVIKMPAGGRKEIVLNDKEISRYSDYAGRFPAVMIAPDDNQIILGGSEMRRKFMDGCLSLLNHDYLLDLLVYQKLLKRRNALLKQFLKSGRRDLVLLDTLDDQMTAPADRIREGRTQFLGEFLPLFRAQYKSISGGVEVPEITYQGFSEQEGMGALLAKGRSSDLLAGRTLEGPHRDDLWFGLEDKPLKTAGSQGQQKSFLVALKLAQYELYVVQKKMLPLLFLDDLFDKFDAERVEHLIKMISEGKFGQVFLTDTHEDRIVQLLHRYHLDAGIIRVNKGKISYG